MTKLVVYLVCEPETPELAEAAVEGGADLVELGFPFSDPLAEGPTIRLASERALSRGMRTAQCLECLAEVRRRVDVPLVPMTYAAILEAYGYDRFVTDTRAAGATSAIVVDLPVEDHPEVRRIQLVAPTSTDERIAACAAASDGWLYLVTLTGTTGARDDLSPALAPLVERVRTLTDLPLYAGFGISTPGHAAAAAELADGVVVGSRVVQVAAEGLRRTARLRAQPARGDRRGRPGPLKMTSAVVVGAGVFGSATARELARRGFDVTLVEQYTPGNVRSGSGGDTRLLRFSHGNEDWYTLSALRALELWREPGGRDRVAPVRAGRRRLVRVRRGGVHAAERGRAPPARDPVRALDARRGEAPVSVARRRRPAVRPLRAGCRRPARAAAHARTRARPCASRPAARPPPTRREPIWSSGPAAPGSGCCSRISSSCRSRAATCSSSASTPPGSGHRASANTTAPMARTTATVS